MTVREFFNSKEDLAIHCSTKDQAKRLLNAFDKEGYKWIGGNRYPDETCWDDYKEDICYDNNNQCCNKECYENYHYSIIEFEDIEGVDPKPDLSILSQFTANELLEEIKRRLDE